MGKLIVLHNRTQPERLIRDALTEFMQTRGWLTKVTHGNKYQSGFPDLFCAHAKWGQRWIDTKTPGHYTFTKAQRTEWPEWEANGVGIWILTAATEAEYAKLFGPPNWRDYWRASWDAKPDIDALLTAI